MLFPFYLLALLPSALAAKEASVTKTFKFTEDFFIEFSPLPTAIGPDNVDGLMSALDSFSQQFVEIWTANIQADLQGGQCTVDMMRPPTFSMCDWKYPDRYDVDELPTPGQCYRHEETGFIQRIYYKIEKLVITCPDNFKYKDLDKDAYTEAAFSGQNFLNKINPPDTACDGNESVCLFDDADTAEWSSGYDACNAELYINRFTDVPVYLKCLNQGYGPKTANKIIKALDKYFELVVSKVLEENIMADAPEGFVYNFASPYDSDRKYCAHGSYYTGGNLVSQMPDEDGVYITKFTYGFDVIWYKPRGFDDELLPDVDVIISEAFDEGEFLEFLEDEYPGYDDFIQEGEACDVIDPQDAKITFAPTEEPTPQPTEGPECDLDTNIGCSTDQVCRLSCVWGISEPQCFDDEEERDCKDKYGAGWICRDSDLDGAITAADNSDGCQFLSPTVSPSELPTLSPIIITSAPTNSPSLRPTTLTPTTSNLPTEFIVPSTSPTMTSKPSGTPTPLPSSSLPTLNPTPSPTSVATDTANTDKTGAPTPLQIRPAETLFPTSSPEKPIETPSTPSPTCPNCIVHPDDTDEDECPIVTTGTCGDGKRGDGICPYAGHCCSEWGWCGTTAQHCESSPAPTPSDAEGAPASPTYSVDAGQCAGGDVGDEFCADQSLCCSDWGYCGEGEQYCFTTRILDEKSGEEDDGTCGGGGVGDGLCKDGFCCSRFGFCGEGELYCTGQNGLECSDASIDEAEQIIKSSPLPADLKPEFGFRCGLTEVDARSNCKAQCTHHIQCSGSEECWGIQLNYCNTFEEGEHPVCTNLDLADNDSRCGYDETSARGHCGPKCNADDECNEGEYCFPTLLNLCDCHEETCPEEAEIAFSKAKALISPYFVERMDSVEGKPRNSSYKLNLRLTASLLLAFALVNAWMM
ncbi:hypothetical protein ACHAXR_010963 [Thalassiosira sp. AJA248-18]